MTSQAMGRTIALTVVGCVVAVAGVVAQQDAFKKGMDERKAKRWAMAASALREAIVVDAAESAKKVNRAFGLGNIGIGGDEYLPFFFLGDSLFNIGDCTGALNAWEESDRQGVARKLGNNARTIENGYKECEARGFLPPPKFARELQLARAAAGAANDVAQRLTDYASTRPTLITAEYREQIAAARTQLQSANEHLVSGERTRKAQDLADSRTSADAAGRQYRIARETIDATADRTAGFARRLRTAEDALQAGESASRNIDALIASSPAKIVLPEALAAERRRAQSIFSSAHDKLGTAGRSQADADLNDVTRLAGEAGNVLDQIRGQVDKQIAAAVGRELLALERSAADGFSSVEARAHAIETALGEHPQGSQVAKDFAALQGTLAKARRSFEQAIRARDLVSARTAAAAPMKLAPQLDSIAALLPIADVPIVPASLKTAAQALFNGHYSEVLSTLPRDTADSIDMPLRVHAHVIRAAALFALYEYSGSANNAFRTQARQEVDVSRSLNAAFRPSPAVFAPRFIDFFLAGPRPTQ